MATIRSRVETVCFKAKCIREEETSQTALAWALLAGWEQVELEPWTKSIQEWIGSIFPKHCLWCLVLRNYLALLFIQSSFAISIRLYDRYDSSMKGTDMLLLFLEIIDNKPYKGKYTLILVISLIYKENLKYWILVTTFKIIDP